MFQYAGQCSEEQAKLFFHDALSGVACLHSHNVTHRDLKLEVWKEEIVGRKRIYIENIPRVGTNYLAVPSCN